MGEFLRSNPVLAIGAVAALGLGGGLILREQYYKMSVGTKFWKSYASDDPFLKYAMNHSLRIHPVQEKLMEVTMKHKWGAMMGAPEINQLLTNLLKTMKAKKVLEVGVYTGFSTLGFALALPVDGKVVGCDVSDEYVNIGRPYWKEANVENKIDVKIQAASKTLDELIKSGNSGTFDMAFIDADKENYDDYFEKCLKLIRKDGIIAIDNVFWGGSVIEGHEERPGTKEIMALNTKLKSDPRIDISTLVTGDGLTLAFKR